MSTEVLPKQRIANPEQSSQTTTQSRGNEVKSTRRERPDLFGLEIISFSTDLGTDPDIPQPRKPITEENNTHCPGFDTCGAAYSCAYVASCLLECE